MTISRGWLLCRTVLCMQYGAVERKRMWSVQNIEPVKLSALAEARAALQVRWESVDVPLDSQTRP